MATESSLPWQLGTMWGWCQRNMPFYGHAQGHVSGPEVLGEPPAPPMARSITAAAPENTCCGTLCSHSETAPIETNIPSVGPLPSASHPSLSTQVGSLGSGAPELAIGGQALTRHARYPGILSGSRAPQWLGGHQHKFGSACFTRLSWVLGGLW